MTDMRSTLTTISDLPEEVLAHIFSYLDFNSLYVLLETCKYFKSVIECCPSFWKRIDARQGINSDAKNEYCIKKVYSATSHICVRGNEDGYGRIPEDFSNIVNGLRNLKVIALENQKFSGLKVCLKDFPRCLEELSVKNSLIKHSKYFFRDSDKNMQKLRVLILDGCRWMHTTYFKWIMKYESLEIFSAANCLNGQFFIVCLFEKYKIQKLRVIDFRFSIVLYLEDLDVIQQPLQAVYFQNVASTESDYGVKIPYKIDRTYEGIGVWSDFECEIEHSIYRYKDNLFGFHQVQSLPESYLYKYPYSECTCGYKDRHSSGASEEKPTMKGGGDTFTAFHKEAMEIDWDNTSTDHSEPGYEDSKTDFEYSSDEDSHACCLRDLAIRQLSLRGFKDVTDETLREFLHEGLDVLDVTGTSVTEQDIRDFLVCNQNCRVVHPGYCVCVPRSPF